VRPAARLTSTRRRLDTTDLTALAPIAGKPLDACLASDVDETLPGADHRSDDRQAGRAADGVLGVRLSTRPIDQALRAPGVDRAHVLEGAYRLVDRGRPDMTIRVGPRNLRPGRGPLTRISSLLE
jgi:hypothetical protein